MGRVEPRVRETCGRRVCDATTFMGESQLTWTTELLQHENPSPLNFPCQSAEWLYMALL